MSSAILLKTTVFFNGRNWFNEFADFFFFSGLGNRQWISIRRQMEKSYWLAQSWQWFLALGTVKTKSKMYWGQFSMGTFNQIRPSLAQCWPGPRFTIICPMWETGCLHFRSVSFWNCVSVPSLLPEIKLSWSSVLNAFTFCLLLSCLVDTEI